MVYTDVWASMGQKEEAEERKRQFAGFQVRQQGHCYASCEEVTRPWPDTHVASWMKIVLAQNYIRY